MSYEQFMEAVKTAVQGELGRGHDVRTQKITKNNGVVLDGLIISEMGRRIAPIRIYITCVSSGGCHCRRS